LPEDRTQAPGRQTTADADASAHTRLASAPDAATLSFGRRTACALLGIDALARAEGGEDDALVVVRLEGSEALERDGYASYDEAEAAWRDLRADAAALPEPDRRRYYDQLCASSLAWIEWRSRGLSFADRLHRFLHVPARPAADDELDALRARMRALLDRLGYPGDLARQCAAWERRHRVAPEDAADTLAALLDEAWERTDAYLVRIPAPRADAMRVATMSGVAYNARCDYLRRTVEVNTDPVLTRPALKHLAVHEGCPGHYLQFKLRETLHAHGAAPADVLLSVINTASSSVFEGIADVGMAAIDWVDDDDDRVQALLNRYRAAIGTVAAWRLHHDGWAEGRVADWLRGASLIGGEGWVDSRMRFIAAPSLAVLIWSYWAGEPAVAAAWARAGAGRADGFVPWLYGRMHSVATVAAGPPGADCGVPPGPV
jgi:hypothetical protein